MPKMIDYPRTTYSSAWELGEIVDDTGGKCAIDTAAHKLNRKASGSFKAIIGSAVKFGLLTSKRELLSTTTLFRRIKHSYDKREELLFHREAFLTPPLFAQLCRRFRSRELPVQMLDIMLIREFEVEEINGQPVAKAFIEGARMVGILDDNNIVADIELLGTQREPTKLASPRPQPDSLRDEATAPSTTTDVSEAANATAKNFASLANSTPSRNIVAPANTQNGDAIANLFGLELAAKPSPLAVSGSSPHSQASAEVTKPSLPSPAAVTQQKSEISAIYQIKISGPGVETNLSITDADDLLLVNAIIEKIKRKMLN